MYFTAVVFVTVFTVANKICVFVLVAAAKAQSVRRLATDWTIRGSNPTGGKINTTSPRSHVFLCLNSVRKLPGRMKYSEVAYYVGYAFQNSLHALKLILL
jgi:hypothetical protein